MSDDPYVYPGTDVLRNMRGIRNCDGLEEFETRLTFLRGLQLASRQLAGEYDLSHLQAFHRYLFAGLYEWAGELRTVVLAKTDLFCLPEHIESYGAEIFGELAEEDRLRGLDREPFIGRLAHYLGDVNALHPFRDGNGRAQRAFFAPTGRQRRLPARLATRRVAGQHRCLGSSDAGERGAHEGPARRDHEAARIGRQISQALGARSARNADNRH